MKRKSQTPPLGEKEFIELEDLLEAAGRGNGEAMGSDEADGFLTCLALDPQPPEKAVWLPEVTGGGPVPARLESLLLRRLAEINRGILSREPLDPVILSEADGGEAGELEPFASGFLAYLDRHPAILSRTEKGLGAAILGVLRHLPKELQGDFERAIGALDQDSPLETPEDALDDLAACVAEIAEITRGVKIPD